MWARRLCRPNFDVSQIHFLVTLACLRDFNQVAEVQGQSVRYSRSLELANSCERQRERKKKEQELKSDRKMFHSFKSWVLDAAFVSQLDLSGSLSLQQEVHPPLYNEQRELVTPRRERRDQRSGPDLLYTTFGINCRRAPSNGPKLPSAAAATPWQLGFLIPTY